MTFSSRPPITAPWHFGEADGVQHRGEARQHSAGDEDGDDHEPRRQAGEMRRLAIAAGGIDRAPGGEAPQDPADQRDQDRRGADDEHPPRHLSEAEPLERRWQIADPRAFVTQRRPSRRMASIASVTTIEGSPSRRPARR